MPKTFKDSDLERMDFELDNPRDLELSLIEKLRLNLNKHRGGTGIGNGYNCKVCGDNMHYFKRIYDIKDAKWNPEKAGKMVLLPIGKAIKLPFQLFYLTGKCNSCGHEQQVCDRPNKVTYWFDEPFPDM